MPLKSDIVGLALPEMTVHVTPRRALAYAAGLDDETALDDAALDFAALPFYCVSLEWQLVIAARNQMIGLSPAEAVRGVHVGQSTHFLHALRPGQDVKVSGRIVSVRRTHAGALSMTELNVVGADGTLLSSSISTGLYRAVDVAGDDRTIAAEAFETADPAISDLEEAVIPLDRGFAHRYSECADIWNPIHTERKVALAADLPDIIVHGTALWALAGKTLMARFGAAHRLTHLSGRFAAMVPAGTPITVRYGATAEPGKVFFEVLNARGEKAVADGWARFA